MLKKLLIIGLLIIGFSYYSNVNANEAKKQEEANKKADADKRNQSLNALNELAIKSTVETFIAWGDYQLGVLPVHSYQWEPIAKISRNDWNLAKQVFAANNKNFHDMYWKIEKVSNKTVHTGFYKSEFDDIRKQLQDRASW